jgi:hypothetical protein
MTKHDARSELITFLDHNAFDPVLRVRPDNAPQGKQDVLRHVQDATRSEKERFHHYGSAGEVVRMFKDDLRSAPAKKVHRQLRDLGLPTLDDVREEFEQLADRLGVA